MILVPLSLLAAGYEPEDAGKVAAADLLSERDERRIRAEYAAGLEAERVEVRERQWEPWECQQTDSEIQKLKNGG